MSKFIGYKNELWKVLYEFEYTGTDQPFTLDPGTYLFICQGGTGGVSTAAIDYVIPPYGGVSYGVIDLNEETTFHAVVGGNGEGTDTTTPGAGGFNGGSAGSISNNTYRGGTGGGGASDIRLLEYDPNEYPSYDANNVMQQPANPIQILYDEGYIPDELPEEYTKLDYVEAKQTNRGIQSFISTGYFPNTNTKLIVDFAIYSNFQNDSNSAFYSGGNTAFQCWSRINSSIKLTVESSRYGTDTPSVSNVSFTFNDRLQIEHSMERIIIRDKTTLTELARNENTGSISGQPDSELVFFTLNDSTSGTRITDTLYYSSYHYCPGRLYEVTIYESDVMVAHLIPAKRNSDNYYGLYDVIREQFYAFYSQSSSYIGGGSPGLTYRQLESIYHCGYYNRTGNYYTQSSYTKSYFNTYYTPTPNTEIVYDGVVHSKYNSTDWSCLFGGRATTGGSPPNAIVQTKCFEFYTKCNSQNGRVGYCRHNGTFKTPEDANFAFDQHIKLRCYKETAEWSIGGVVQGTITMTDMVEAEPYCPIYLWTQYTGSYSSPIAEGTAATTLYSFKIYEVDSVTEERTLVRDFVPCERTGDNQIGLFDLISHTFNPGIGIISNQVIKGEYVRLHPSIDSRIMVAGGGGGTGQHSDYTSGSRLTSLTHGYACCGGGAETGFVCTTSIGTAEQYEPLSEYKANQTSGYHLAYAIQGINKNYAGSGGSGGGWYSGYVSQTFSTSDYSYNGMGGSGYVYTNSSYKPEGYNPPSKYQFHDIYMGQGQSNGGKIIIAKLSDKYDSEDTLEFPSVGEMTSMMLKPGTYTLKCYGGDGGYRYLPKNAARGGYSQGDLTVRSPKTIYVSVGGSGFPHWNGYDKFSQYSHSVTVRNCPATSWNGGGTPNNSTKFGMVSGGGGTDIRIDGNTLYHRLIVAGGAGSEGTYYTDNANVMRPTDGGGLEGGPVNGNYGSSTSYGTTNGPGTQTNSPNANNATVAGSFGQGGPSYDTGGSSQYPGAGGGGWYGGSGTYSESSNHDYQKGGCGGSGYVLTEDSYKPEGYQLTSDYYLENAFTVQGGNNLDLFITKAIIEVQDVLPTILAKDSEGYKYFDDIENEWLLIDPQPTTLTPEIFETYSASTFSSDAGLENEYSLYLYDEEESISGVKLYATPNKTTIVADTTMTSDVLSFMVDSVYDPTVFDQHVYTRKENGLIRVYVDVEKLVEGNQEYSLYNVILDGKGGSSQQQSYHYFTAEELALTTDCLPNNPCYGTRVRPRGEMDDYRDDQGNIETAQWLLPVKIGGSKMIPTEYVDGLFDSGTSQINTIICVEYKRLIYMLASVYRTDGVNYYEIHTYNPETKRFGMILRKAGSTIAPQNYNAANPSYAGFQVDDDYFYFTMSYYSSSISNERSYKSRLYMINRSTEEITSIPSIDGSYDSTIVKTMYGDCNSLKWYDDECRRLMFVTNSSSTLYIFDKYTRITTKLALSSVLTNISELLSFNRFGNYIVFAYKNTSSYYCLGMFDKTTNTAVFNTSIAASDGSGQCGFCKVKDKFYVVTYNKLRVLDATNGTLLKTYTVPWGTYHSNKRITPMTYVNGAIAVANPNTNWVFLFNIEKEVYSMVYTNWTMPAMDNGTLRNMVTCRDNMLFFPGGATPLVITYMGNAKYNIGYKYNKYRIDYTDEYIADFTYDEGFVSFDQSCATVSDGYVLYNAETYTTDHITHVDISKSDYRYTHGVSIVKTEPEPEEEGEPY